MKELPLIDITDCFSKKDIAEKLKLPMNGKTYQKIDKYILKHSLNIDHFDSKKKQRIYAKITKECPVCLKTFETYENSPKEKTTCSHSCSNTYFRSGLDNPNYKNGNNYRTICFNFHKHECVICKESKIVAVHHYDENHNNNEISNLVPLCPTHHVYIHSKHKDLIIDIVEEYVSNFKKAM